MIRDPMVVGTVQSQMRGLWQAEIQARGFGLYGHIHPFDSTQLPLLSSMEFNDALHDGSQSFHTISWPAMFHEDPTLIQVAVKHALRTTRPSKRLTAKKWVQFLCPGPQTWFDLESSLAKIVEQLIFCAGDMMHGIGRATYTGCTAAEVAPDPTEEPGKALTSRAAKRLRQRERRKLCKKGFAVLSAQSGAGASPSTLEDHDGKPTLPLERCDDRKIDIELPATAGESEVHDDGASDASASTSVGCRSRCSGQGAPSTDSPRAVDSLSELSGEGRLVAAGCSGDFGEGAFNCKGGGSDGSWKRGAARAQADAAASRRRRAAQNRPWWDVSDEEDDAHSLDDPSPAWQDDARSTEDPSSSASLTSHRGRARSCPPGSFGRLTLDAISAKDALEEPEECRRDGASCAPSELEGLELPPLSRQSSLASGCETPVQLWPPTPEHSPRHGPTGVPCTPTVLSLPCWAPGRWEIAQGL